MLRTDGSDGGPAFAHGDRERGGDPGMSLRDWFAGQALSGIAGPGGGEGFSLSPDQSADWAYQYADAMLAKRNA